MIFHVENPRGAIGPLEQSPDPDKIPSFGVCHRRVSDALEKMRARNDALEEFVRAGPHQFRRRIALHEKVKLIDLLPHLARDLFARGPRVLARAAQAGKDRVRIFFLETDEIDHRLPARGFVERSEKLVLLEGADDRVPLLLRIGVALISEIEEQLKIHIRDAGVVLRPLDVAAHPVEGIGDAAKHVRDAGCAMRDARWETLLSRIPKLASGIATSFFFLFEDPGVLATSALG